MIKTVSIITAAIFAITPATSKACAILLGIEDRLTLGYDNKGIAAVALVKISAGRYTGPKTVDEHTWRATAKITRMLRGNYTAKAVVFDRGRGSSACDDGHPLPKNGELWVIYFWQKRDGTLAVWQSYPAGKANKYDPKLKGRILKLTRN